MYSIEELKNYENQILNMDCIDFLKNCPDNYFDLVLTDPPYGIGAGNIKFANCKTENPNKFKIYKNNDWDIAPQKKVFDEIIRISKNQIIWGGNYFGNFFKNSRCWLVWDKLTGDNSYADCELAYTSFNSNVKKFSKLWLGAHAKEQTTARIHPTQKPLALFEWCLKNYSNENDLILDCFSGSGTTAVACHNLKRRFICIEKDYEYWKASCRRLEIEQNQARIF